MNIQIRNFLGPAEPIFEKFKIWWMSLQLREQNILILLSIVMLVVIAFYGVYLPSEHKLDAANKKLTRKQSDLMWVKEKIRVIKNGKSSGSTNGGKIKGKTLISSVNMMARSSGLKIKRLEPENSNRIRIWLEDVKFNTMLEWLDKLDSDYNVRTANISLDAEKRTGYVNAKVILTNL